MFDSSSFAICSSMLARSVLTCRMLSKQQAAFGLVDRFTAPLSKGLKGHLLNNLPQICLAQSRVNDLTILYALKIEPPMTWMSMFQDFLEAAANDVATGLHDLGPSTSSSTPYSGNVVQSLVRKGLVQASSCLFVLNLLSYLIWTLKLRVASSKSSHDRLCELM